MISNLTNIFQMGWNHQLVKHDKNMRKRIEQNNDIFHKWINYNIPDRNIPMKMWVSNKEQCFVVFRSN